MGMIWHCRLAASGKSGFRHLENQVIVLIRRILVQAVNPERFHPCFFVAALPLPGAVSLISQRDGIFFLPLQFWPWIF